MRARRFIGVLLLVAFLAVIELAPPLRSTLRPLTLLSRSLKSVAYRAVANFEQQFGSFFGGAAARELAVLRAELATFGRDEARLAALESENASLKDLVGFKAASPWAIVATRVVGRDPGDAENLLRIGAGGDDGVPAGAAVVNTSGVFVGQVERVGEVTSTVRLVRSRQLKVPVRVIGRDGMVGLLQSLDGLSLKLRELPKSGVIEVGDIVETSSERAGLPPGIPVGSIVAVTGEPEELWREALVAPLATLNNLDVVAVLIVDYGQP